MLNLNLELGYKSPVAYKEYGLARQSLVTKSLILVSVLKLESKIVVSTFFVPSARLNQFKSESFVVLESLVPLANSLTPVVYPFMYY